MKIPGFKRSPARTTLLGVASLGVLLWAAVTQLGVGVNSLLAQLLLVLAAVFLLAMVAGLCVMLVGIVRRRR